MPAKSKKQFRYIQWLRSQPKSKKTKWAQDKDWTPKGTYKTLPENKIQKYEVKLKKYMQERTADKLAQSIHELYSEYKYKFKSKSLTFIVHEIAKKLNINPNIVLMALSQSESEEK